MKNNIKNALTVFIHLFLHSAILIMLIFLLVHDGVFPENPFITMALIVCAVVLALYTTHAIVQSITEEITRREKELSRSSTSLQAMLTTMGEYAQELERHTTIIRECGKELEKRAHVINGYSKEINRLVAMIEFSDGGFTQAPNGAVNKKTG